MTSAVRKNSNAVLVLHIITFCLNAAVEYVDMFKTDPG